MQKTFLQHTFPSLLIAIIILSVLQGIDYGYFAYLHNGLKFPDYFPIMLFSIFFAWKYIIQKPFSELVGIDIRNRKLCIREFFSGLLFGTILVFLALGSSLITQTLTPTLDPALWKNILFMLVGYVFFIPISALYEELHYRWLYNSLFSERYIRYIAIVVSAIIFALVHVELQENAPIYYPINMFLFALILSIIRFRWKSIIALVGIHSAWNFLLILFSPFFGSDSERYIEFTVVTTCILTLVLSIQIYLLAKKK